jgi:hypothetical protein
MTENHHDFTANSASHGVGVQRLVRWFVRGTKPDGTRWESARKHDTREDAEAEMEWWGPEMGDMKIMRLTYPKGFEHLRERGGNHYGPPNDKHSNQGSEI